MQSVLRTGRVVARAAREGYGCDRVRILAISILAIGGDPVATVSVLTSSSNTLPNRFVTCHV